MRSFVWKLAIAFVLSYALLVVVVVFAYTTISSNFIIEKGKRKNLVESSEVTAKRVNAQLMFDYDKMSDIIEEKTLSEPDVLSYLHTNKDEIIVLDDTYQGFGRLNERNVTIDNQVYTYDESLSFFDINQRVSIMNFFETFNQGLDKIYIFFLIDDIIAYFEAEPYLEKNHE